MIMVDTSELAAYGQLQEVSLKDAPSDHYGGLGAE